MAKQRSGSGGRSNMGLIITLVFFVLSTLILGVTTYFGFADQDAMRKAKDDAIKKEKVREEERNWYRFQALALRQYCGIGIPEKGPVDSKELARLKGEFDKGTLKEAKDQTDKDAVVAMFKELDKAMPWKPATEEAPPTTYQTRLADKDKAYAALQRSADALKKKVEDAERDGVDSRTAKDEAKKMFDGDLAKVKVQVDDDRKKDREEIIRLQGFLNDKGKEKETETLAHADTRKKLEALEKTRRTLEGKLATATKDMKEIRETLDETKTRMAILAEKSGADLKVMEQETLNAKSLAILKSWSKNWQVTYMDRRGTMPYINLGSADGLTSQVTFSIHSLGLDGKLNPIPKGTLEVVKVTGAHSAQTRVTSVKDPNGDPIIKGDRLFNPTWDPDRKPRIALAGIADLGGDGTDNTEDFRQLLSRQGVILDAYIDTKDEKAPKIIGKGITTNTDYLVLAEGLETIIHSRSRSKDYVAAFDRLMTDMKLKANTSGVTVITLRKYLDMIGYRASKVTTTNPTSGGGYSR